MCSFIFCLPRPLIPGRRLPRIPRAGFTLTYRLTVRLLQIVVDLALYWTQPSPMGSNVDSVVEASLEIVDGARRAGLPVFFSTCEQHCLITASLPQ